MHQHRGSVALQISQLAMAYGGVRTDGIAVLRGGTRLSQADNQVFNQSRQMSSALLVAKQKVVEFIALPVPTSLQRHRTYNAAVSRTLFPFHRGRRFASEHLVAEEFALHVGVPAD